jgi:hypothetical protein
VQNISRVKNTQLGLEQRDCVKETSLLGQETHHNNYQQDGSIRSLPRESKIRSSKVIIPQREHIKDNLLPNSYDEYYTHGQQQKAVVKVPILLSGSNSSTKDSQSAAYNELGLSRHPRHSG